MRTAIVVLLPWFVGIAYGDTSPDVSKDYAKKVLELLKPRTIVISYCQGCDGAFSVVRVRKALLSKGRDDPNKHRVVVERDLLLTGESSHPKRLIIGTRPKCGGQLRDWCSSDIKECPSKREYVDLAYAFIKRAGAWVDIDSVVTGNAPTSRIAFRRSDARRIKRCAARLKRMPSFTLGSNERVWGIGDIQITLTGQLEVAIRPFDRPVPRGRKVTVVAFHPAIRSITLGVTSVALGKTACLGEPKAELTLPPIRRRDFVAVAKKSKYRNLCDAAVLHPARRKATYVPTPSIKQRDLPAGFKRDHVRGSVDLSGNGRPDLLYVNVPDTESTAVYHRTRAGWKRVVYSNPC